MYELSNLDAMHYSSLYHVIMTSTNINQDLTCMLSNKT